MSNDARCRGGHRAIAKKLIKQIEELLSANIDNDEEIEVLARELERHNFKMEEYDAVIQSELEQENMISDMEEASTRRIEIQRCLIKVRKKLDSVKEIRTNTDDQIERKQQCVQLPKLLLPRFNGDPTEWMSFWDIFEAAVHSRSDLSPIQKFSYFRGQLDGEAAELLGGFALTQSNYAEAIALAAEVFGKPHRIVQAHLHAVFDLKTPKSTSGDLRKFRASFECSLRALKTLDMQVDEAGFVFVALLMRKLPTKIKDNINRAKVISKCWTLDQFREAIDREIEHLQFSLTGQEDETSNKKTSIPSIDYNLTPYDRAVSLTVSEKNAKQNTNTGFIRNNYFNNRRPCLFCQSAHPISKCLVYKTVHQRKQRLQELNLCTICLMRNHVAEHCTSPTPCFNCKCNGHNSSICPQIYDEKSINTNATSAVAANSVTNVTILLPTAIMQVASVTSSVKIRALFDQGSQKTFLLRSVADELSLQPIGKVQLTIDGFSAGGTPCIYDMVQFNVITPEGTFSINAIIIDRLPNRIRMPGIFNLRENLINAGLNLADPIVNDEILSIALLVGADHYYDFVRGMSKYNNINLIYSNLGYMFSGPISTTSIEYNNVEISADLVTVLNIDVSQCSNESNVDSILRNFWELESIGIMPNELKKEEVDAINKFNDCISFDGSRYVARLPWKGDSNDLPSNFNLAKGRLLGMLKKLSADKETLTHYNNVIQDQLKQNFIEIVDLSLPCGPDIKVHYLSHHAVHKDSPTTPLRVVMNCSAKQNANSLSLNDCLLTGPSLVSELGQILLRFRLGQYACLSDIAKAYLMIGLHDNDRDSTRFLWPENVFDRNSKLITYRFKVVLFGATSSQFLLNATILHHLKKYSENPISYLIERNLYIDNVQGTAQTEEEILHFYNESKIILNKAGLVLREWVTNSPNLLEAIELQGDGAKGVKESGIQKFLGISWEVIADTIKLSKNKIEDSQPLTKRNMTSQLASVFDPLGFVTPVTIKARIFLQQMWKLKIGWDEVPDNSCTKTWCNLKKDLIEAVEVEYPRKLANLNDSVDLFVFSDASDVAYGVVAYFKVCNKINWIMSKARVAPIKKLTIPQLELTAAVLATRLACYIHQAYKQELKILNTHFFTDSQVILGWIKNSKSQNVFVRNRIQEIHANSFSEMWHYVPSKENPADLLSRGISPLQFKSSLLWRFGPSWLGIPENWPLFGDTSEPILINSVSESPENWSLCGNTLEPISDTEKLKCNKITTVLVVNDFDIYENVIDYSRFSKFEKLLKVMMFVIKFVFILKKKVLKNKFDLYSDLEMFEMAEKVIVKDVQREKYKDIFLHLKGNKRCPVPNIVFQLKLFLCDDIIRSKGRIEHANLTLESKYPILLPGSHYFTELVIKSSHVANFHSGLNSTIAFIRQKWWITQLRQRANTLINQCTSCKRVQGCSYTPPPEPALPKIRVEDADPFSVTGVDYSGFILVKEGKSKVKVYIALFTCAVTRAIHLEIALDGSAESFLQVFRRFVSRRGCPRIMLSDNASNFVAASGILQNLFKHPSVSEALLLNHCQWRFIPSRAPWFGGFWERMIGLTKTALKKKLGRAFVNAEELRTIVAEVEARLNDRPLTYVSNSIDDADVLTPSHLLYGRRLISIPNPIEDFDELDKRCFEREVLTKRQIRCSKILEECWDRWKSEYLLALRERNSRKSPTTVRSPKLGDVVLIHEDCQRSQWRLGRILKLHEGVDGYERSAVVKTCMGNLSRPITKLYPLECNNNSKMDNESTDVVHDSNPSQCTRPKKRQAALLAGERIKLLDI